MPSTSSAHENFAGPQLSSGGSPGGAAGGVCITGELLADMLLEVPPLIERVGLVIEGLGRDSGDVCEPRVPDRSRLHEMNELERV